MPLFARLVLIGVGLFAPAARTAAQESPAVAPDNPAAPVPESEPSIPPGDGFGGLPRGGAGSGGGMGEGMRGGGMGGMGGGGPPGYVATWYPGRDGFGLVRQSLNLGLPVWRGDAGNMLLATVGVRHSLFLTDAVLPDTRRPFPDQLWNLTVGLNYLHRFENGWTGMLITGVGSASDRPFQSVHEMTATLGGFLRIPAKNGRDHWMVGAIYLAGGPVDFPLPVLAYTWNPSDRVRVNLGLPLSVNWRPTDEWELNLAYVPLLNVTGRLTYKPMPLPGVQVFGGYEFLNETYLLADRPVRADRFFAFEQRAVGGVRWDVGQHLTLEANGGYAFGRSFGEGRSQWAGLRDRVRVPAGPFLGVHLGVRF